MPTLKNKKHEKFAKKLVETGKHRESYQEAFPKAQDTSAQDRASRLLQRSPEIRDRMKELLEQQGLGVEALNEKLYYLTKARRSVVVDKRLVEVEDNTTSLAAVQTAYKLHKLLNNKEQPTIDARSISLNITSTDTEILNGIAETLSHMNRQLELDDGSQTGELIDVETNKV